jgi:hypothetical protein
MIFIADLIACSTCFNHHYAHHQELENIIQLCLWYLMLWFSSCRYGVELRVICPVFGPSVAWLQSSNLLHTMHTAGHPTFQHHNSYNRTEKRRQWNAVWPDDGRKDTRNMLRNNWLPIKSLIVASSWSRLYLQITAPVYDNPRVPARYKISYVRPVVKVA